MNETEDKILLERIARFSDRLSRQIVHTPLPLALEFATSEGALTFSQRKDLDYKPISVDTRWGQHWEVAWFRATVPIPETHRNKPIVVRLDLGGEGLVFDNQGRILQGISSGSVFLNDSSRDLIHVSNLSSGQDKLELWIEASACGLFGVHTDSDPQPGAANRYG
ncbi:MAG: hypothetical protein GY854_27205, partial [Deltaproteobacteria bacterium]|nr:hypothetical protein [Deltaproteobacteria bacterium]